MFVNELKIYIAYLREQLAKADLNDTKPMKYYRAFCKNMQDAVEYYSALADRILKSNAKDRELFIHELQEIGQEIRDVASYGVNEAISTTPSPVPNPIRRPD